MCGCFLTTASSRWASAVTPSLTFTPLGGGPGTGGLAGSIHVYADLKARVLRLGAGDGIAVTQYRVPAESWGVDDPAATKMLVQQIVFTATEEIGIDAVRIVREDGEPVVIGGVSFERELTRSVVRP